MTKGNENNNNNSNILKSTKYKFAKILCPKCIWRASEEISHDESPAKINEPSGINFRGYTICHFQELQPIANPTYERSRLSKPLPDIPNVKDIKIRTKQDHNKTFFIPDLRTIFSLPYYWGSMNRYEAEAELKDADDGLFLLRDSAQDDFMFSVSFKRFGRTIHARMEYFQGCYSFDSQYGMAPSIPLLLSQYQKINESMFYHPLCRTPLNRRLPFSLQDLCKSVICSSLRYYEDIYELNIPKSILRHLQFGNFKVPFPYSNFNTESNHTTVSST